MIDPPETRALRARSVSALSARKTSASSNRSTQPHLCASRKQVFNLCSTLSPVLPISPTVILNSGHFVSFATHSVVDVLPTPGAPRSRIMRPFSRVSNFHVWGTMIYLAFAPNKIHVIDSLSASLALLMMSSLLCMRLHQRKHDIFIPQETLYMSRLRERRMAHIL